MENVGFFATALGRTVSVLEETFIPSGVFFVLKTSGNSTLQFEMPHACSLGSTYFPVDMFIYDKIHFNHFKMLTFSLGFAVDLSWSARVLTFL